MAMTEACELDASYPRFWLEYDQLAARLNRPTRERLEQMENHIIQTQERDDLYLRYITLLNCDGQYEKALSALRSHKFHPWEGGEGKVSGQYRYALIQLALNKLKKSQPEEALALLEDTISYPANLGEGKLPNVPDNQAHYYMGIAYRQMGEEEKANGCFTMAAAGSDEPGSVLYYNDQPSDYIFYQGLANQALGRENAAKKAFHKLIHYGEQHMFDTVDYDFFAVSLPEIEVFQDAIQLRNELYCNYLRALGALGLQEKEKARNLLTEILKKQADYQGALSHLGMAE